MHVPRACLHLARCLFIIHGFVIRAMIQILAAVYIAAHPPRMDSFRPPRHHRSTHHVVPHPLHHARTRPARIGKPRPPVPCCLRVPDRTASIGKTSRGQRSSGAEARQERDPRQGRLRLPEPDRLETLGVPQSGRSRDRM